MISIVRRSCFTLSMLFTFVAFAVPVLAEQTPDIVILFDQSGSMGKHDPKLASRTWLLTFIRTFSAPYKVAIDGFDERIHKNLIIDTTPDTDYGALNRAVDAIPTRGYATDFEAPFRYLLEMPRPLPKLVLLVSDGEPEIWDQKLEYLSRAVREDQQYDDLNIKYHELRTSGTPKSNIFDQLGAKYYQRNIDLIEGMLPRVKELFGNRLIIWDLSGKSYYLRTWAKGSGAQYLPIRVAANENPVEQLRTAMYILQREASTLISENLPQDHETRTTAALMAIPGNNINPVTQPDPPQNPEPDKLVIAPTPPIVPVPVVSPVVPAAPTPALPTAVLAQPEEDSNTQPMMLWFLLLVAVIVLLILHRRRHKIPPTAAVTPTISDTTVEPVPAETKPPFTVSTQFIDDRIRAMLDDAEKLRRRLLAQQGGGIDQDKRFSLRVVVPEGAMEIFWIAENGSECHGHAVNISMHGIQFEAPSFDAASISRIDCLAMGVTLHVAESTILRVSDQKVVALLDRFKNHLDDRMRWVEIITRID